MNFNLDLRAAASAATPIRFDALEPQDDPFSEVTVPLRLKFTDCLEFVSHSMLQIPQTDFA